MKNHTVNIKTPEVTDVTDNVASLATFGFSYIKNATDRVCEAIGTGFKEAKEEALIKKQERQMGRMLREGLEIAHRAAVLEKLNSIRKGSDNA